MAEQSWPHPDGPIADTTQWRAAARLWRDTGVIVADDDQLQVEAVAEELEVRVRDGQAWVDGHYYRNTSPLVLPIATADLSNPRIDRVVVEYADNRDPDPAGAVLRVLEGTPAASPTPPALTQTDGLYQLPLAQVLVPAAATEIDPGDITDERVFSEGALGSLGDVTTDGATAGDALAFDGSGWAPRPGYRLLEIVRLESSTNFQKGDYPAGRAVLVKVQAGGGGGSIGGSGDSFTKGAGGGAGGYGERWYTFAQLSATEPVVVGSGGAGGSRAGSGSAVPGSDGGTSSFKDVTCSPGQGGGKSATGPTVHGGAGGGVSGADFAVPGGSGQDGGAEWTGSGGSSYLGIGGTFTRRAPGEDGRGYGSGGAADFGDLGMNAGDGAPGIVIIEVYS